MLRKYFKRFFKSAVTLSIPKTLWYRIVTRQNIYVGKRTLIMLDKDAVIKVSGKLYLDSRNDGQFWYYSSIRLKEGARLSINGEVNFFSGVSMKLFSGAEVSIGEGTYFSGPVTIHARKSIRIGEKCSISWNCSIIDSNFHEIHAGAGIMDKETVIGNHVWIGNNVTILPGAVIEDYAIIGAGSVVRGLVKGNAIHAGVPARLIKER